MASVETFGSSTGKSVDLSPEYRRLFKNRIRCRIRCLILSYHRRMPIDMMALARTGAETRIKELLAEVDQIRRAFPGIGAARRGRPRTVVLEAAAPKAKRGGRRKPMTAAERKAVSARMRKYWAARRK
jgi:hypothetical protein